jgi:outer membrane protein
MKKLIMVLITLFITSVSFSQKTAYVDTEYMLNKIPAYKEAQKQIDNLTKQWQKKLKKNTLL